MRVLVTGANGFVGKNLIPQISSNKELEVIASDILPSQFGPTVSFRSLNVTDESAVASSLRDIDVVVHMATHQLVPSISDPRLNAKVNILGTLNILEGARKANVRKVIFTSASSIVGDVLYNPVDEKHPCDPKTPYGVTKLACEYYLKVYQKVFSLDYLIFRFFNIYGPHQTEGLIPTVYQRITQGKEFDIYGDGNQMRDYVYVEDLGELFIRAILKDTRNMTLNVGTGEGLSILDIVELAGKILRKEPKLKFNPPRPGEIGNFVASTDASKAALGIVPTTPIEHGLKRTFDWLGRGR